jgi:hypothetical protein
MEQATEPVSPEEVARRIEEYRCGGFARKAPAQVVYHPEDQPCPWPGCGLRIAGIRFRLEDMGGPPLVDQWLSAFWNGPGLVGRCPACKRYVLFDILGKQAVPEPLPLEYVVLPDAWEKIAHLVIKPA